MKTNSAITSLDTTELKPTPETLKTVKILSVFSDSELKEILTLGEITKFDSHSNIVIEGELSWGLYLILKGKVGISKTNKMTGESHDIIDLKAGSFFGEMSLIDDNPRSATVRALTEVEILHISKDAFYRILSKSPELTLKFYQSCIKTLVVRLRELDDNYVISQHQLWQSALRREVGEK